MSKRPLWPRTFLTWSARWACPAIHADYVELWAARDTRQQFHVVVDGQVVGSFAS